MTETLEILADLDPYRRLQPGRVFEQVNSILFGDVRLIQKLEKIIKDLKFSGKLSHEQGADCLNCLSTHKNKFKHFLERINRLNQTHSFTREDVSNLADSLYSDESGLSLDLLAIIRDSTFTLESIDQKNSHLLTEEEFENLLNLLCFNEGRLQQVIVDLYPLYRREKGKLARLAKAFSSSRFILPKVLKFLMEREVFSLQETDIEALAKAFVANDAALPKVLEILMNTVVFLSNRLNQKFDNQDGSLTTNHSPSSLAGQLSKKLPELLLETIVDDRLKLVGLLTNLLNTASEHQLTTANRPTLIRLLNSTQTTEEERQSQLELMLTGWQHRGWHLTWRDLEYFPCADLQSIDILWKSESEGRFGFSAQQQVWQHFQKNQPALSEDDLFQFGQCVGWRNSNTWIDYNAAILAITEADATRFWLEEAPCGHLPLLPLVGWWCWAGGMKAMLGRLTACAPTALTASHELVMRQETRTVERISKQTDYQKRTHDSLSPLFNYCSMDNSGISSARFYPGTVAGETDGSSPGWSDDQR
ncbi:GUN4 domain-containing protein [Egbenema bharatensis]|uniref:GUN4 domain-containing protein n=1 Tax=Egbenema bharatensis TaxID=3463334 RepID=UPI003A85FD91